MLTWLRRWREKRIAQKQKQVKTEKEMRVLRKQNQEECGKTGHEWTYTHEVQGDGDPNVEGYILITTRTCWVCGETETEIEPYDKDDE